MTDPTVSKNETVADPLDCPFCDAPARTWCAWGHWGVECTFCEARIRDYSTREGAVSAWNRPRRMPRPDRDMDDPVWIIRIEPCCKEMSGVVMMNDIRQGIVRAPDGSLSILWGDGDMMPLRYCPCCGKKIELMTEDERMTNPCEIGLSCPFKRYTEECDIVCAYPYGVIIPEDATFGMYDEVDCPIVDPQSPLDAYLMDYAECNGRAKE